MKSQNFQPFPKAVVNSWFKREDPLTGVSAELHKKRGKGRRMYGGKGHPYADSIRAIDKGKRQRLWKNLMVKRSMVTTIEAPRVGPWQIRRIQTSNDKTWTMRLGTRRLRSAGFNLRIGIRTESYRSWLLLVAPIKKYPLSMRKWKARLKFGLARVKDVKLKTRDAKLGL